MLSIIYLLCIGLVFLTYLLYQQYSKYHTLKEKLQDQQEVEQVKIIKANLEGRDQERIRIAQDWHDGIGNSLSTLRLIVDTIQPHNQERHSEALALLEQIQREFRQVIDNELVINFGDKTAIMLKCKQWKQQLQLGNIDFQYDVYNLKSYEFLPKETKNHIFRLIQELMSNAIKHANPKILELELFEDKYKLYLKIKDNGEGMDGAEHKNLRSIERRLSIIGGTYKIKIEKGTTIFVEFPFEK